MSTFTPLTYLPYPDASALRDEFSGRTLAAVRTPALVIDRGAFQRNCEAVTTAVADLGMGFRAHIKTHKTPQGTRLQVEAGPGVRNLVASTMPEVWGVLESGLIEEGKIDDILYSLPISPDRMEDLTDAQEKAHSLNPDFVIRVMVDNAEQVVALDAAAEKLNRKPWSVFVKVDGGGKRAGAPPRSAQMKDLIEALKSARHVRVHGFYSHFGQSYASRNLQDAGKFYAGEIECVRDAAAFARELGLTGNFVLSVGATPTTQAAVHGATGASAEGTDTLELHAGCYCLNDLQQEATGVSGELGVSVLATVVGTYPDRGEVVCDAGALALSKDVGPEPGFGRVVSHPGWNVGRVSQEHGVLTTAGGAEIKYGERVKIVPNHACLACACYPWFYVVDGDKIVDVWVPWKGW